MKRPRRAAHRLSLLEPAQLCRAAAMVGLLALGVMVVGVLVPRPAPVLLGMGLGQGLGALAFMLYLGAIVSEMRRNAKARRSSTSSPHQPAPPK